MPMKTVTMLAATINSISSSSSARLSDASVKNVKGYPSASCHAATSRSNVFTATLLPIRLSSTMNAMNRCCLRIASNSRDHLRTRLQPRLASKRHDDVAELALKRTAAAELNAAEQIVLGLQQVVPRHRHLRHVGSLELLVPALMPPLGPLFEELRPGRLRFADEDRIGEAVEVVLLHGDPRTADDREDATGFEFAQNLAHSMPLDAHAGEPHDVGPRQTVVVDRLDVLIDDRHAMPVRGQRGEQAAGRRSVDCTSCPAAEARVRGPSRTPRTED